MSDKERLGKIKVLLTQRDQHIDEEGQIDYHEYDQIIYELNDFGHIDWLINRVEKLELEINDWRAEVQKWQQFYKESEESHLETKELLKSIVNQNKRYKQALEFYADGEKSTKSIGGTGMKATELLKQVIDNENKLKSCTRHRFAKDLTPDRSLGKRWKCINCGGEVDSIAKNWYEKGLKHAGVDLE